jgi:hypothetical protein
MAEEEKKRIEQIRFIYRKARHHRTFHSDGIWASVTPQLEVQFALFNNLKPMPEEVTHRVTPEGVLGEEIIETRKIEQSVIREVDATIVMSKETMTAAIELLQRMLRQIDEHVKADKEMYRKAPDEKSKVS